MSIIVILPNALRPLAANNERVFLEAATAGEALTKLFERYPDLGAKVQANLDDPTRGAAIYRNSVDLRKLEGMDTPLQNDDRVTIIIPEGHL